MTESATKIVPERDPDTPDMFKGKAKGAIKPVKKKAEAAPGDGEGPGWKDAPSPKERAAARKPRAKPETPASVVKAKAERKAAREKAAREKALTKKATPPIKSAAKPKAKPKPKAAPKRRELPPRKPKASDALIEKMLADTLKPKQTRVRDKTPTTAILVRMTDPELAKLDKKRGTGETRPACLMRLAREAIGAPAKK